MSISTRLQVFWGQDVITRIYSRQSKADFIMEEQLVPPLIIYKKA